MAYGGGHQILPCASIGGNGWSRHMVIDSRRDCAIVFDSRHGDEDFRIHRVLLTHPRLFESQMRMIVEIANFPPGILGMCISYLNTTPQTMDTFHIDSSFVMNAYCVNAAVIHHSTEELIWLTSESLMGLHLPSSPHPRPHPVEEKLKPRCILQFKLESHCSTLVQNANGDLYVLV